MEERKTWPKKGMVIRWNTCRGHAYVYGLLLENNWTGHLTLCSHYWLNLHLPVQLCTITHHMEFWIAFGDRFKSPKLTHFATFVDLIKASPIGDLKSSSYVRMDHLDSARTRERRKRLPNQTWQFWGTWLCAQTNQCSKTVRACPQTYRDQSRQVRWEMLLHFFIACWKAYVLGYFAALIS